MRNWTVDIHTTSYNELYVFCVCVCVFQVRFEIKRLWYKIRGQKLELDDIAGTRSSVYSVSFIPLLC